MMVFNNNIKEGTWYYTKDTLLKDIQPTSKIYLLSADSKIDTSAKKYTFFYSGTQLIHFIKSHKKPHFHEIIYDIHNYPCYLYFDIDQDTDSPVSPDTYQHIITTFQYIIQKFIKDIYKYDITLVIGHNMQVSYTKNPNKLSLHIKINIKFDNVDIMKSFVENLDRYMCSDVYVSPQDRSLFYHYKKGVYAPTIDHTVYANFRCYRTFTSSKWKTNAAYPLIPWHNSSYNIADHLIRVYHDIQQPLIDIVIPKQDIFVQHSPVLSPIIHCKTSITPSHDNINITTPTTSKISQDELTQIQHFLTTSPIIKEYFDDLAFDTIQHYGPDIITLTINKKCNCICPYVKRIHKSNRSYFQYNSQDKTIKYKCFDDECQAIYKQKAITFNLTFQQDALQRLAGLQSKITLHCKEDYIVWNEVYEEHYMRSYPLKPLVCIRANMGAAKTQSLVYDFIPQYCNDSDVKCLFITYQILLSKKYHGMLKSFGFVNYLDATITQEHNTHMIHDNKIIVCLDSLWRVATRNFNYIFIDEVLSVLLHFNSPLMKKVSSISTVFELLLLQADYVYLIDACVDNNIVYNFANYLSSMKNIKPYWIRNTYIRPSNRVCDILVNNKKKFEYGFKVKILNKIVDLLRVGKKIVVSSSTKVFTERVINSVHNEFGQTKRVLLYNSDTDKKIIHEHAINPNGIWTDYDILVYSPSISAGISFEVLHFDELVSYIENSFLTPTVDLVLQQMFRVRQLIGGKMNLYINDVITVYSWDYPVNDIDIGAFLDKNICTMNKYFPEDTLTFDSAYHVSASGVSYDKNRMSYEILKGILGIKNKSIRYFTQIIKETLTNDYNIPCTITTFDIPLDQLSKCVKMEGESYSKADVEMIDASNLSSFIIDEATYNMILTKERGIEPLTLRERCQKHIYQLAVEVWGVRFVDIEFFKDYIGYYNDKKVVQGSFEKYYGARRFTDLLNYSIEVNRGRMKTALQEIVKTEHEFFQRECDGVFDKNFEIYRSKIRNYYTKLIEGSLLVDAIWGVDKIREKWYADDDNIPIMTSKIKENFEKYMKGLDGERFKTIQKVFELDKRYYPKIESLKDKINPFIKSIVGKAFAVEFKTVSRYCRNRERKSYGEEEKAFNWSWFIDFKEKYGPTNLHVCRDYENSFLMITDYDSQEES